MELIRDQQARNRHAAAIREAGSKLTWDAAAARLLDVCNATCDAPPTRAKPSASKPRLSEDAIRLVGPGGALPRDLERPLLALATHPQVGRPVFGAIKASYRAFYSLRRRIADNAPRGT